MKPIIGHLDADCFYVSAERVRYLDLHDRPIGVLGNQGAAVIAKSYEMKARGVTTGMPIWDALKLCPEGIYMKRDFRWYEVLSRKMLEIVRSISHKVEYYSIDEFFFEADFGLDGARRLQQRILSETGIPVTIGLSWSRSLAKLISDGAKPFGCLTLFDGLPEFLSHVPVEDITGIGGRSAAKLKAHGIATCFDYTQASPKLIRAILTVKGEKIWYELNGEAVEPIQTKRAAHKAISRGGSLGGATADRKILKGWLVRNTERLVEELDYYQVFTEHLVLFMTFKPISSWGCKVRLPKATASFEMLLEAGAAMLSTFHGPEIVSHMHLLAERLSGRGLVQQVLFDEQEDERIAAVKAAINSKIGRFALRSAETLALTEMYLDPAHDFDVCDIRGKTCF